MNSLTKLFRTGLFSFFTSISFYGTAQAECGAVDIADMNWESATFIAHVDQFILENAYGCEASLVPANTQTTGASLVNSGKPEVTPEFWSYAMKEDLDKEVEAKKIRYAGTPFADGAIEGFWVPSYMVEANPELTTIKGVLANAHLFMPKDNTKKASFYGCPEGWNCNISSLNLFKALNLQSVNFQFVTPPTGTDLDIALQEAYENKAPWFGYYWSPTAILGRYKMVMVDFETGVDHAEFKQCTLKPDCKNPKVTMFPTPLVQTIITEEFAKRAPKASQYLSRRGWSDSQMNEILAWMEANQADGVAAMEHFLKNYQSTWVKWVDGKAVRDIREALNEL
ncbi:glycine betaine ABC transporter substrate-binding protein [Parendozoicomonas sp. Alg238-R29]|uniref:glycine betaine ABC transporter substrate-binding protein n=1 Tax=Parendozoicomonas sp. Alg238-R29 TaxID=2993446 RepID=UPI00248F0A46|nr:glycine betaine ABC transporter substrate-binding protein [Parendozoicomonas sp. Alg238-R29]